MPVGRRQALISIVRLSSLKMKAASARPYIRRRKRKMASYIGAIDQGTTSSRFIVFDRSGRIVSTAQREHEQIYPKSGWVEHDPEEMWCGTDGVILNEMETR